MSKLLTVFGATGNQGGSIIKYILGDEKLSATWKLRGITRDTSKAAALELANKGVEIVAANLDHKSSVVEAVQGSTAVFGVTNFWEMADPDLEIAQGKHIADACKETGVQHLIWSSLPNVTEMTHGKNKMTKHFDSKATVEKYIREQAIPASFVMPGFFMSNLHNQLRKDDEGNITLGWPFPKTVRIPWFDAADDTGLFVAAALIHGPENKYIVEASAYHSGEELLSMIEETKGVKTTYVQFPMDKFVSVLPQIMQEEMEGNFLLIESPGYFGPDGEEKLQITLEYVKAAGVREPTPLREYVAKHVK